MTQSNKVVQPESQQGIEIENLTKKFGGLVAVNNLDFTLKDGELLGLIGPNGAGKTTVYDLITGFHKPTSGTVSKDGELINGLKPSQICKHGITRTFQIPRPLSDLSIRENVMIGAFFQVDKRTDAQQVADEILDDMKFEPNYETPAGELPIAGKKKLEVAKSLATDPDILLLDEVMAGLNTAEVNEFIDVIKAMRESMTIMMIEHNVDVIMELADRILVMEQGEKIALDYPQQIQDNDRVIEAYLGAE